MKRPMLVQTFWNCLNMIQINAKLVVFDTSVFVRLSPRLKSTWEIDNIIICFTRSNGHCERCENHFLKIDHDLAWAVNPVPHLAHQGGSPAKKIFWSTMNYFSWPALPPVTHGCKGRRWNNEMNHVSIVFNFVQQVFNLSELLVKENGWKHSITQCNA